jgi:hypothetical protein
VSRRASRLAPGLLAVGLVTLFPGPPRSLAWERMDPETLGSMSDAAVLGWALRQVGPHLGVMAAAAERHRLPPRLLATCILNELADYGLEDQLQELFFNTGSVGMAQMQVPRAIEYHRVDIGPHELDACVTGALAREPASADSGQAKEFCQRYLTWQRLNEPGPAIEAAARELDWILDTMNANLSRPWQRRFLTGPIDRARPYAQVRPAPDAASGDAAWAREERLAVAVCTAYNAPSILKARAVGDGQGREAAAENAFLSARRHGRRAARLAGLLARARVLASASTRAP